MSLPRVQCQEVEEKVCFEQAFTEDVSKEAEKCSAEVKTHHNIHITVGVIKIAPFADIFA